MKILLIDNKNTNADAFSLEIARYLQNRVPVDTEAILLPRGCPDWIKPLYAAAGILRLLPRLHRYDAVLSLNIATGLPLLVLQRLAGKRLLPLRHVIFDVGMTRIPAARSLPGRRFLRWLLSAAAAILCHAESSIRFWKEQAGVRCPVVFLPLPLGADFLQAAPARGERYIFSAGRFGRDYGTLIAAMKDIPLPLVIVGDDANYDRVKNLLAGTTRVTFHREIAFRRYRQLLEGAALVVLPLEKTEYHTGQTVLLQAMACGKPVIATRSNGAADYVSDGTTALLVDAGDRAGLREKIRYLLEHPGAATAMGEAARKKIREEYSGERFGERAYALFQQLVQNAENVQRGTHEEK